MFDETRVQVETVSAGLDITQPAEISLYAQVFDLLQRSAVYGRGARELIRRAVGDLSRRVIRPTSGNILEVHGKAFVRSHQPMSPGTRGPRRREA